MKKLTTEEFIEKSILIHGNKYSYSLSEYKNKRSNIIIVCSLHGEYTQNAGVHLRGFGCPKCKYEKHGKDKLLTIEEFIKRSNIKHSFKYNYSNSVYISSLDKIEISCLDHGLFWQKANTHLLGAGCPKCNSSKGELRIIEWLNKNNIEHVFQNKFIDLYYKSKDFPLIFDFYLPERNILIEFDGIQHFRPVSFGKLENKNEIISNFNEQKRKDELKNKYAQKNKIKLIRISYLKINEIEIILEKELSKNEEKEW